MRSPAPKSPSWLKSVLDQWARHRERGVFSANVTALPKPARTGRIPDWIHPDVARALRAAGAGEPYSHQIESWQHLAQGKNIAVATPTASGKTLCYAVPVIDRLATDPLARALFLFPTKALSRDQEGAIGDLVHLTGIDAPVATYDGDTSGNERRKIRESARVIITNPDMLHTGILPHHTQWGEFFSNLAHVVIDELHTYRGVFGSHVSNVIQRLRRVTRFHGHGSVFAACSATIRNPLELAQAVVGEPFELITESGAPTGPRTFVVYNPPVVDPVRQVRKSAFKTASRLAADLIAEGVVTLVFCQTRRQVEIVLRYIQDRLQQRGTDPKQVRGYRGGYLPVLRREIETALKTRALSGVVATNALELGIDVGDLDAVVMAGYPGTIAALRQRAGRAGRRQGPSLAVLVATADPLDQFLASRPAYLFESSPEQALVQPDNVEVLLAHLRCAAFELPFDRGEAFGSLALADTRAALDCLVDEGDLVLSEDRYHYIHSSYPAAGVSLRQVGPDRIAVIDEDEGAAIAEVDMRAARAELYEQAVYQHEGQTYAVNRLDLLHRKAYVSPVEPAYYTAPISRVMLDVVQERDRRALGRAALALGDVKVTEEITGFKKVRFYTHENLGYGEVSLDPVTMETEGLWLEPLPELSESLARFGKGSLIKGLEGLGHVLHQVASLRLMCDPRDMAHAVQTDPGPGSNSYPAAPVLHFYDAHPGGVGLSDRAFEEIDGILKDTSALIAGCRCAGGCPSCVGPVDKNDLPVKQIAKALVSILMGGSSQETM